jgi:gliding motility-associated-like protein
VYCQGAPTVPLQATGTGILWYTTATSGVGQSTITPSSAAAGQFSFYATQTVNGCESPRKQTIVTINATPAPPTTNNPSWCEYGAPVSITANGQNILWYTTATGGTGSTVPPVAPGTGSGTYTYYVTQTVGGCESPRAIATITVKPKPAPPFIAGPFIFCQYAPSSPLTAQGQNLLWYSTPAGAGSSTTAPTPSTSYAGIQQYYVSQTVAGCESDRALVTVDIREKPNATFTYSRPWVCAGDTLQFNYYGNGLPSWDYRWKAPLGAVILSGDSTQGPVIIRFNEAGTKTVSLVVQNGGCPSDRMSLSIDVRPLPVVAMNLPAHGCVDEDITVSLDSASRNIKSFVWTFDGATVKSGTQTGGPYELTWNTPGIKVLTATGTANGCPNIPDGDTIEIHDHPKPRIRFNKPDRICAGDSVLLMAEQTAGSHYAWTPAINFINTSEAATVWASVSRTRYLTLQETDQWGCAGTDSVLIEAQPCCDVFVPTAFTPNGDGLNDDFGIASPGNFIISAFRVYNRWGQTVWESANSHGKWNGTQGGSPAPMGTYFYRIKYKCMSGEEFEKQGDLTLIR